MTNILRLNNLITDMKKTRVHMGIYYIILITKLKSNLFCIHRLTCAVITILSWLQLSTAQNARCFKRNPRLSTDGCSVPIFKKFPYKKVFEPACNRHDICYICVSKHFKILQRLQTNHLVDQTYVA